MDMLLRTPQPHPTESLLGYVLRVSEANGYESPARMLRSAGTAGKSGKGQIISPQKLSALVGCDAETIRRIANNTEDGDRSLLLGEVMIDKSGPRQLRLSKPGFCPQCVAEIGYIEAMWDLRLLLACHKHQCETVSTCHVCGERLDYYRPGLLACSCGADLGAAPVKRVSNRVADLMRIIGQKAHGNELRSLVMETDLPISRLESLSISDICYMLDFLIEQGADLDGNPHKRDAIHEVEKAIDC